MVAPFRIRLRYDSSLRYLAGLTAPDDAPRRAQRAAGPCQNWQADGKERQAHDAVAPVRSRSAGVTPPAGSGRHYAVDEE